MSISIHSIPVVADLAVSHEIDVKFKVILMERAECIAREMAWDNEKDGELLQELREKWQPELEVLPESRQDVKDLISEILKRYVDRTRVDADFRSGLPFAPNHFLGNSQTQTKSPLFEAWTVEEQQNIASYLLNSNPLTSASWLSDICCAVFAGHGARTEDGSLSLYCTLKNPQKVVEGHFYDVERYWTAWFAFIKEQKIINKRLIIVLDLCHSGAAIVQLSRWCANNRSDLDNYECSVEMYTSCADVELARGGYFLQCWYRIFFLNLSRYYAYKAADGDAVMKIAMQYAAKDAALEANNGMMEIARQDAAEDTTLEANTGMMDIALQDAVVDAADISEEPPDSCLQHPQYYSSRQDSNPLPYCTHAMDLYKYWQIYFTGGTEIPSCFDLAWRGGGDVEKHRRILATGEYDIVDVRFFCSGAVGALDGYQIGALIQPRGENDSQEWWNQHVHLCSKSLEGTRDWKPSAKHGASVKTISPIHVGDPPLPIQAGDQCTLLTYPKEKCAPFWDSAEVRWKRTVVGALNRDGMEVAWVFINPQTGTNPILRAFDSANISYTRSDTVFEDSGKINTIPLDSYIPKHGSKVTYEKLFEVYFNKVRDFLTANAQVKLYLGGLTEDGNVGVEKTVSEWRKKCESRGSPVKETELKPYWITSASIKGLSRTRFVSGVAK